MPEDDSPENELADFLTENGVELFTCSLTEFGSWLEARLHERVDDEEFQQQRRINVIESQHREEWIALANEVRAASSAFVKSGAVFAIRETRRNVERKTKAVEGLTKAEREGRAKPEKARQATIDLDRESETLRRLTEASREHSRLVASEQAFHELKRRIGWTEAVDELARLRRSRGRRSGRQGHEFERRALHQASIRVLELERLSERDAICVPGATLECPRGEFDGLVVTAPRNEEPVEVLAMIEAKRNVNDLASGFRMRQENLAWFTNDDAGFNPEDYRSQRFPSGRFEATVRHRDADGREFIFDLRSFHRFQRDPTTGHFLAGLYFATRRRPLTGVSSVELSIILNQMLSAAELDLKRSEVVASLRRRILAFLHPQQSRDVLRIFQAAGAVRQIVFVDELDA